MTVEAARQCEQFAPHLPDEEALYSLRRYMDKKPFFKGKGFTFGLLACAINDWSMEQVDVQGARTPPPAPPVVSEEEQSRKQEEMQAKKAAVLAKLAASAAARKAAFV